MEVKLFLCEIMNAKPKDVDENSRLCQEVTINADKSVKTKIVSKMEAAKLYTSICGFNAPVKIDIDIKTSGVMQVPVISLDDWEKAADSQEALMKAAIDV